MIEQAMKDLSDFIIFESDMEIVEQTKNRLVVKHKLEQPLKNENMFYVFFFGGVKHFLQFKYNVSIHFDCYKDDYHLQFWVEEGVSND